MLSVRLFKKDKNVINDGIGNLRQKSPQREIEVANDEVVELRRVIVQLQQFNRNFFFRFEDISTASVDENFQVETLFTFQRYSIGFFLQNRQTILSSAFLKHKTEK